MNAAGICRVLTACLAAKTVVRGALMTVLSAAFPTLVGSSGANACWQFVGEVWEQLRRLETSKA